MKSTRTEKGNFSLEDFAKGLMLAGYLMPMSISELDEREALENHETEISAQTSNVYFKRVVLAAEIVSKLHEEPTLGRIKFQKLVYLCEHVAGMKLYERYSKQAAGPFDNKFMHSITNEFKKNKWFSIIKIESQGFSRSKYLPLENSEGYKKYYDNYFNTEHEKIQYIIELFRKTTTDFTELATTVFACFIELKTKETKVKTTKLLPLFYEWSEKKKRFTEQDVLQSLDWLGEKGLIDMNEIQL